MNDKFWTFQQLKNSRLLFILYVVVMLRNVIVYKKIIQWCKCDQSYDAMKTVLCTVWFIDGKTITIKDDII